jgi:filamentous hemagglutinin family protein
MKINSGGLAWHFIFFNSLAAIGILVFSGNQALAQVTPDSTLGDESSVVNTRDASSDSIDGGATRGQNLFHSFQEFNVDAGRGVYFANPEAVTNIFSRVTGNDVSNILGTLGVDGAANLFLINPNGIIFGEGASLDVNGSFAATTADGMEFGEQGFFSASNPQAPNLLTINPSAYLFNQVAPGAIVNNSTANNIGLQVQPGKNLSLIGGDITLDSGLITAAEAEVKLGGLSESGSVNIQENGSLSFPDGVARSNVFLGNGASVNVSGNEGGSILVNANNLELSDASSLVGGIASGLGTLNAQAGDIILDATGNIDLTEASEVLNQVKENAIGNAGKINIQTGSLTLDNESVISASTFGNGNSGNVTINTTKDISNNGGGISSNIIENAVGNSGNINITTGNLTLTNAGQISANTFGQGEAGNITINASGTISADGKDSSEFVSGVFSQVAPTAQGNSGDINITTDNLNLTNQGVVTSSTFGRGNAGNITINANDTISIDGDSLQEFDTQTGIASQVIDTGIGNGGEININAGNLILTNGGAINSSTFGQGNAGKITINANDTISIDGDNVQKDNSGVFSTVQETGKGSSGDINITTGDLALTNGGVINAGTYGQGDAGKITINASGMISADGEEDSEGFSGGIFNTVEATGKGNSGGIDITTDDLILTNGGLINAGTYGQGDAGKITINANGTISVDGENSLGFRSIIGSQIAPTGNGNSEGIEIKTTNLTLTNGATVDAGILGQGNGGKITINASGIISVNGESSQGLSSGIISLLAPTKKGNTGEIEISTSNLSLAHGGQVSSSTYGQGNASKIIINAHDTISVDGENSLGFSSGIGSQVTPTGRGNSDGLEIKTNNLTLTNGGQITSSTYGQGNAGKITINANGTILADGENSLGFISSIGSQVAPTGKGNSDGLEIKTNNLTLTNGGQITNSTLGQGNTGKIIINANGTILADGESSQGLGSGIFGSVENTAKGNSNGIEMTTSNLLLSNQAQISSQSFGQGNAGNIQIKTNSLNLERNSSIFASNTPSADISTQLSSGNINLQIADNLILRNSDITTQASINANGGNINITADGVIAFDDSDIFAFAKDGQGGNINLNTPAYFAENFTLNSLTSNPDSLNNNSRADLNATGAVSGAVAIPDVSFIQNSLNDLPDNSINTDELVANSCVSPVGNRQEGKFIITGKGGLPARPGNGSISDFSTGKVRNVSSNNSWQRGEPIVEPQGVYRLANGKLVMSRECSQPKK